MSGLIAALALVAMLTVGMAGASAGDDGATLATISRQLVRSQVLRADFHQEKVMRALKRPLVTEGQLIFVEGRGVLWQVIAPYAVRVLVKADEIVEWEEGASPRRMALGTNPIFRALSHVFLAALAGNVAALGEQFDVQAALEGGGWQLKLAPKDPTLASVFSVVQVDGGQFIETVRIAEVSGDQTTIRFGGFKAGSGGLDDAETAYFAY